MIEATEKSVMQMSPKFPQFGKVKSFHALQQVVHDLVCLLNLIIQLWYLPGLANV